MFGLERRDAGLAAAACIWPKRRHGADIMVAKAAAGADVTPNEAAYLSFAFGYRMLAREARRRCASG